MSAWTGIFRGYLSVQGSRPGGSGVGGYVPTWHPWPGCARLPKSGTHDVWPVGNPKGHADQPRAEAHRIRPLGLGNCRPLRPPR